MKRDIYKFDDFFESKKEKETQKELSDDIQDVDVEITDDKGDKMELKDYYIEDVLSVSIESEEEYGNDADGAELKEGAQGIGIHADLSTKQVKRGDILWITALLRRRGSSSFTSPAKQGVLKVRVVDIYYGLKYLNKVLKQQ